MVSGTAEPLAPQSPDSKTVSELYAHIGWGKYQVMLFAIAGVGYMSDSIETALIAWLDVKTPTTKWPHRWDEESVEKKKEFVAIMVFFGQFLGCFVWGPMADRIGRKPSFLLSNAILLIFGVISAFSPTFWIFVAMRTIVGAAIGGIIIPFDNLAESIEEKLVIGVIFGLNYFWTAGSMWVNIFAAIVLPVDFGAFDSWRVLTLVCTFPIILACMGYFIIEESPLWLQEMGREDEAFEVLKRIARVNGKELSGVELMPYSKEAHQVASLRELVRPGFRRRSFALACTWFFGLLGYYGSSLAQVQVFGEENGEVAFGPVIFGASGELLGVFFGLVFSRRIGYIYTMGIMYIGGTICTAGIMLKGAVPTAVLAVVYFLLRGFDMGGNVCVYVATPLAYHTYTRATAHGFHFAMGRLGGLAATIRIESLNAKIILYSIANMICCIVAFVCAPAFSASNELKALEEDQTAADEEKRSASFIRAGGESSVSEMRRRQE